MFVLVTQADGSARRLPWISYALVVALAGAFLAGESGQGGGTVEIKRLAAVDYFEEYPFVQVDPAYAAIIDLDYAEEKQEEYLSSRRKLGLPLLPKRTIERAQEELDSLLADAAAEIAAQPEWRLGVSADAPVQNLALHIGVHETRLVLALSLFFLLLAGIPLEDGWGSLLFGFFSVAAVVLAAQVSLAVDYVGQVGLPWIGAGGLVSAYLGAYLVRSLPGASRLFGVFPLPGWMMLPVWVGFEYVARRQMISADTLVVAPVWVHNRVRY